jgi:hypothetical protein
MVPFACHPNYAGNKNRRLTAQTSLGINLSQKITKAKRAEGIVQAVSTCLPRARP